MPRWPKPCSCHFNTPLTSDETCNDAVKPPWWACRSSGTQKRCCHRASVARCLFCSKAGSIFSCAMPLQCPVLHSPSLFPNIRHADRCSFEPYLKAVVVMECDKQYQLLAECCSDEICFRGPWREGQFIDEGQNELESCRRPQGVKTCSNPHSQGNQQDHNCLHQQSTLQDGAVGLMEGCAETQAVVHCG